MPHPRSVIELHTLVDAWGLPTFSPFGLKLICYLRMRGIPFSIEIEHNPGRAPKGKLPWIVDGTSVLTDSGFIVDHLEAQARGLDAGLDPRKRAAAHSLRRMVEESLCFSILYFRWCDPETYRKATDVLLRSIPQPGRSLVRPLIRRRVLRDLKGQGVLRHCPDEVSRLGSADLDTLAHQLDDSPFMLGERPSTLDATVAGFLAVLLCVPLPNPLERHARSLGNLSAYCERMRAQYLH